MWVYFREILKDYSWLWVQGPLLEVLGDQMQTLGSNRGQTQVMKTPDPCTTCQPTPSCFLNELGANSSIIGITLCTPMVINDIHGYPSVFIGLTPYAFVQL